MEVMFQMVIPAVLEAGVMAAHLHPITAVLALQDRGLLAVMGAVDQGRMALVVAAGPEELDQMVRRVLKATVALALTLLLQVQVLGMPAAAAAAAGALLVKLL
jgi:hypothetical protein